MALTAYLTDTTKRINSTQIVPITGAMEISIALKDNTDIVHPTFLLDYGVAWNPASYNYIKVTDFSRAYFIDRWFFEGGIWNAVCTEDVLASFKTEIGYETKYILRSSSNPSRRVTDYFYPITDETDHNCIGSTFSWYHDFSNGYFVMGVIGTGGSGSISAGSVTYLVLTATELAAVTDYMLQGLGTLDWTNGNDIKNNITRVISDPLQYIVSCMFFPFQPPTSEGTIPFTFGFWEVPTVRVHYLSSPMNTVKYGMDISNYSGYNYLNQPYFWGFLEPLNSYILMLNPWGTFPIPSNIIAGRKYLGFEIKTDFVSGLSLCNVYAHSNSLSTNFSRIDNLCVSKCAQVGVQIQISNNTSSLMTAAGNTISGAVSGAGIGGSSGSAFGALAGALIGGIANAATSISDKFVSVGANGGIAGDEGMPELHVYHKITNQPSSIAEFGSTCCGNFQISTLSGYIQCADGANQVNALKEEKDMIAEFMASGFYYE